MTWVRVDDQIYLDKDLEFVSPAATCLHIMATAWCAHQLTDGFITTYWASRMHGYSATAIAELVNSGWWVATETGYHIRSYLKYNPSREQVVAQNEARTNSGRIGGLNSGNKRRLSKTEASAEASAEANAEASAEANAEAKGQAKTKPVPVPVPVPDSVPDSDPDPIITDASVCDRRAKARPKDIAEIEAFLTEIGAESESMAIRIWDFYESKGWRIGKEPMKDWRAAVRGWVRRGADNGHSNCVTGNGSLGTLTEQAARDAAKIRAWGLAK